MENKGFHITITDNETGEVLHDIDTGVIIGAADEGEGTRSFAYIAGSTIDIVATIMGVKDTLDELYDENPEFKAAEALAKILKEKERKETAEN